MFATNTVQNRTAKTNDHYKVLHCISLSQIRTTQWLLALLPVFIMLQFSWTVIPAYVILCTALPIATVAVGIFYTNLLPFILDQMIGASAEELSAAVHWYYWGFNLGPLTLYLLQCIPIWSIMVQHNNSSYHPPHTCHTLPISSSAIRLPTPQLA